MANRVATAASVATPSAAARSPLAQSLTSASAAWYALGWGVGGSGSEVVVVVVVVVVVAERC